MELKVFVPLNISPKVSTLIILDGIESLKSTLDSNIESK